MTDEDITYILGCVTRSTAVDMLEAHFAQHNQLIAVLEKEKRMVDALFQENEILRLALKTCLSKQ
jgi:hypothetical protein